MKITKGQLKRIIAEEHQVVFGKGPVRGKSRKSRKLQERKLLAERKKQILVEAKAQMIVEEEMLQEFILRKLIGGAAGLFGGEKGLATQLAKSMQSVAKRITGAYEEASKQMKANIDAISDEEQKAAVEAAAKEAETAGSEAFMNFAKPVIEKMVTANIGKDAIIAQLQTLQGLYTGAIGNNAAKLAEKLAKDIPDKGDKG